MASSALEEKINKIRQQNEEIRRRYEEVEADKKNAAKSNALVQLVPSDDWPERREPPEFSAPPKTLQKQISVTKDRVNERPSQHYSGIQERLAKKEHKFAEGEGPPPDPKYNFLADSERETRSAENSKPDEEKNKARNRTPRGGAGPRKRGGGNNAGGGGSRDAFFKDNRDPQAFHSREESLPEYEAWRAERDRIDEARINRQKTAEGNWRREWDCNKVSLEKDQPRRDFPRKDPNMFDRRNNHYDNDYSNRGHGGSRTYHQSQKNYSQDFRHPHHEQPHEFKRQQSDCKTPLSPVDNRTVAAFDQSIKVTVNQGGQANKPAVMSVKVNSPSIAGTGRVGPRQKSRITYSSQSDANAAAQESNSFMRQKSFDEKTAAANFNNGPKLAPKSPFSQRKREGNPKSPYFSKKEFKTDESTRPKNQPKASHSQRNESRDQRQSNNLGPKPQRIQKQKLESNKAGNVSVFEDSVPVENDFNKTLDNEFCAQNNDSIETNEIGKEILDVSNVSNESDVGNNEITANNDENVSYYNEESLEYDSNIENEESFDQEKVDNVTDDRFEDAEENHKNIELDSNVKSYENPDLIQNNDIPAASSALVNENIGKEDLSTESNKESLAGHVKISQASNDVTLITESEPTVIEAVTEITAEVKVETSVSIQPLDNETKETTQTLDDIKSEVEIDLALEKTENIQEQKESFVEEEKEMITQEQKESVVEAEKEMITQEQKESVVEEVKEMITQEQKESVVEEEKDRITQVQIESVVKEEKDSVTQEQVDIVEPEKDSVTQEQKENVEPEKDSVTQEEKENSIEEKKEDVTHEQCEEKMTSNEGQEGEANKEESTQSSTADLKADDSKVEDNSASNLIESEENTLLDNSLNKPGNDSGFLDNTESDSLNKTNTSNNTSNDSAILSDSNVVEDLNVSLDNPGAENKNDNKTVEPAKSDFAETTKDVCEKPVEICDNVSSASSDIKIDESNEKVNEVERVDKVLDNSIKDNDAKVVENDHQSSDSSKVTSPQDSSVDVEEKKVIQVSNASEELKKE